MSHLAQKRVFHFEQYIYFLIITAYLIVYIKVNFTLCTFLKLESGAYTRILLKNLKSSTKYYGPLKNFCKPCKKPSKHMTSSDIPEWEVTPYLTYDQTGVSI